MPLSPARPEFTARYFVESSVPSEKAAQVIAGEQSSGIFTALPGETEELKARSRKPLPTHFFEGAWGAPVALES